MCRILLLSFALVCPALAERAVYTGSVKVQNLANPSASSVIRIAEVIDLESGKIVTVGLTGTKLDFSFHVGPETECVIAKATDAKGHSTTAFAQAAAATDQSGSKFALSTVLRGADATVTLADAGPSHWPRTLIGSGSLVVASSADTTAKPGGISLSTVSLTLSEPYSKLANSSGGTLAQASEVVGQAYRDAVAKSLKYPSTNGTASTSSGGGVTNIGSSSLTLGSNVTGSYGLVVTGAGTGVLTGQAPTYLPAGPVVGGVTGATLNLGGSSPLNSGSLSATGGTLILNSGNSLLSGVTTINNVGGITFTGATNVAITNPVNLYPITGSGASLGATTSSGSFSLNTGTPVLAGSSGIIRTTVGSVTGLGGTLTVSGSSLENVVSLLPTLGSHYPTLTGLTVNGGNVVNASGTVVGTVTTSPSNATVVTFDPAVVNLGSVGASLTDVSGGTFTLVPRSGTTIIPTLNLITTTPSAVTDTGTAYTLPSTLGTAVTDSSTPVVTTP